MPTANTITLRGVRVHNLKNIDVAIPLGRLTAITGVSGAGKSSLVFDTLYAEAQRRYLQSFSAYTRQFLERFEKPDAEEISDLPPAVAIRSGAHDRAPHAAVASLTEIGEHLRLLFARGGVIVCPECQEPVTAKTTADVLAALEALPALARCTIAFPLAVPPASDQPAWLAGLLEEGYLRVQAGENAYRLGDDKIPLLEAGTDVWILLDRVEIGKTPVERLRESVDAGFRRSGGRVGYFTDKELHVFDERLVCSRCGRVFPPPEPGWFDMHPTKGWHENALWVRVDGRTIADWHAEPIASLLAWTSEDSEAAIRNQLQALVELDLGYLTLGQPAASLSDGSIRRIGLASALASDLVNVLYLIDEPSAGLHPAGIDHVKSALRRLAERGNTVVVIEHERRVIESADHVIDLGPGAGEEGGSVTYQGPLAGLADAPESPTSDYWTGRSVVEPPASHRKPSGALTLSHATINNVHDLTVAFPLGVLCVITGPPGAGKRSLIEHALYPALCLAKKKKGAVPSSPLPAGGEGPGVRGHPAKISGVSRITDVVLFDQKPLPKSGRSNAATYLKIFDEIRALFASTVDAKIRNFGPGQFSFNQAGGRCETCEGQGALTIDMQFLADVSTVCPECQGRRYRQEILDIKVRSLSIAQVLELTVREAFRFFRAQAAIEKKLKVLLDVGLDYIRLGQALDTLAGGECQRLKLAGQLASSRKSGCLFLLIEPSAGLHAADVANLLECFGRLLDTGHSLIVIDNHPDVAPCADHVIAMDAGKIA